MEKLLIAYENDVKEYFFENVETIEITAEIVNADDEMNFDGVDTAVYFGKDKEKLSKFLENAKDGGVKRIVYVASAICFFNRRSPEKNLEKHPFVKSQVDCENEVLSYSDKMSVSIAELPSVYKLPQEIFAVDGVPSIKFKKFFLTFDGGYPEMSAENVAESVLSVAINGENGVIYPLCDKNAKFKAKISERNPDDKVYEYPEELWWILALKAKTMLKKQGLAGSVDIKKLYKTDIFENYFFDDREVRRALKYENE